MHSGTGFKHEDRAVDTVSVQMFANFQDEILELTPTECIFRILCFSDLRSGKFSTQPIIPKLMREITLLPITFESKVLDE